MPIERLYTGEKFFIVSQRDENLSVIADRLLQNGQWSLTDFMFFKLPYLSFVQLRLGNMRKLTAL